MSVSRTFLAASLRRSRGRRSAGLSRAVLNSPLGCQTPATFGRHYRISLASEMLPILPSALLLRQAQVPLDPGPVAGVAHFGNLPL